MKKLLPYILIFAVIVGAVFTFSKTNASVINPNEPCNNPTTTNATNQPCVQPGYNFLAPLPGQGAFDPTGPGGGDLGKYLDVMIKVFIGVCAVLAVIMIVIGGLEYMTNELISHKEEGKKKILGAIFGLVLALGAWTILYTINPDLLKTDLSSLKTVEVEVELAEDNIQATATNPACVEADMVSTTLFGKSVTVNKSVVSVIQSINAAWLAMPQATRYQVNSVGGYNCRKVIKKPGYWSAHSFGLAVDINPSTNPYGKTLITDMPPEFRNLFTSKGWGWGGNWINIKDAMHFSSTGK